MRGWGLVVAVLLSSALVILADPAVRPASACSCAPDLTLQKAVASATTVFDGYLQSRDDPPATPNSETARSTVVFTVLRVFKGSVPSRVAVFTSPASGLCGSPVSTVGRYLVIAYKDRETALLGIGSCPEPRALAPDERTPAFLGSGRRPIGNPRGHCLPGPAFDSLFLHPCDQLALEVPTTPDPPQPESDVLFYDFAQPDLYCVRSGGDGCQLWHEVYPDGAWCWEDVGGPTLLPDRNCDGSTERPTLAARAATRLATASAGAPGETLVANVTTVNAVRPAYVSAGSCADSSPWQTRTAAASFPVGFASSSLALVPANDGACLFNLEPVDLVVDAVGKFAAPATGGLRYTSVVPRRIADTRPVRSAAGFTIIVPRTDAPAGAVTAVVTITALNGEAEGFVSECVPAPTTAVATYPKRLQSSNLAIVTLDHGSFCLRSSNLVDLVIDVHGYFGTIGGDRFSPTEARRLLDTRLDTGASVRAGSMTRVHTNAPPGTTAVAVGLSMIAPFPFAFQYESGYVTAGPCSEIVPGPQSFVSGTHASEKVASDLAFVRVDASGDFCVFNLRNLNLVVDLFGSFGAGGTNEYFPVPPARVLDTRKS